MTIELRLLLRVRIGSYTTALPYMPPRCA